MDIKVYKKETVNYGSEEMPVFVPDVIDIIPEIKTDEEGNEILYGAVLIDDNSKEQLEQECALATIFQRGLDPLDLQDGIEWSEALLGEVNVIQLMEEISNAVSNVTTSVTVVFDTVTDAEGNSYLSYKLQEVA